MLDQSAAEKVTQQWLIDTLDVFRTKKNIQNDEEEDDNPEVDEEELEMPEVNDIEELTEFNSIHFEANSAMNQETVKEVCKHIWDTGTRLDMGTGSAGLHGGVDGSLNHTGNMIVVSNICEATPLMAADFGSGTGYTGMFLSATTNFNVIGVEVISLLLYIFEPFVNNFMHI